MKKLIIFSILILTLMLAGCGVSQVEYDDLQAEYDKLKEQNAKLEQEIDELKYGEDRLIKNIEEAYSNDLFSQAKENILLFKKKYPNNEKNNEFDKLLKTIENKEEEARIKKNINNTGMWKVKNYVDQFDNPTEDKYIVNSNIIKGKFSNSATQDSPLNVRILINSDEEIKIMLYEYAGNNPVKAYSSGYYYVYLQDCDGIQSSLRASIYSDRLNLDYEDANAVHKALLKGGPVKFKIVESDNSITEYEFTIKNTEWYENAYRILTTGE